MRRRGARRSVLRCQHFRTLIGTVAVETHLNQRADHDADHLPEKSAAFKADEAWAGGRELAGENCADRMLAAVAGTRGKDAKSCSPTNTSAASAIALTFSLCQRCHARSAKNTGQSARYR